MIKPDYAEAYSNLGGILGDRGQVDDVLVQLQKALEIRPGYAEAHNNLGLVLAAHGQVDEAIVHFQKALEIKPAYVDARTTWATPSPLVALEAWSRAGARASDASICSQPRSRRSKAGTSNARRLDCAERVTRTSYRRAAIRE